MACWLAWGLGALAATQSNDSTAGGFRALLWRTEPKVDDLTRSIGGMCVGRGATKLEAELEKAGLDYLVFNAAGRDDLHLDRERDPWRERWRAWRESRDPALLVREPCLAAPATIERLRSTLGATLAERSGQRGLGVSLGDEVGLTPGGAPLDVCQCEHCEQAFTRWSAGHPRACLRTADGPLALREITTDGACRALAEGDTRALGPWLARRDFHQDQLLEVLTELGAEVRRSAPEVRVGLLGLAGRTAFAGVALERILPALDFAECYRVGDARELLLTLRRPDQAAWITVFRDERGPAASAWQAWEHWARGGDGVVVWSDVELLREPALAQRLERALSDIDALDRAVGDFRPTPHGVALVHSPRSLSAAWLREAVVDGASWPNRLPSWQEQHGLYESARNAWIALLEDCGAQCGSWPSDSIDASTAQRFPLLVASNWLVVDEAELAGLERYLDAGGSLWIDGEFAWVDSNGVKPTGERRKQLSERHPGRIVSAERAARSYSSSIPDRALVERVRTRLASAAVALAPWRVGNEGAAWIQTWCESPKGIVGAVLPKLGASSSVAAGPRLRIELAPGTEVEWLHPTAAEANPSVERTDNETVASIKMVGGDAAVFRLAPAKAR